MPAITIPFSRNSGIGASSQSTGQFKTRPRVLAARFARGLHVICPSSKKEGAGNAGCTLHPRSRVQKLHKMRTRAYRFSGNTPAFPAQWFDGLCRALPGDEFVFVTVAAGLMALRSGWIDLATGSLTSATDARTTRFCRTLLSPFVLHACCPLTASRPANKLARRRELRPPHPIPRS